MVCVPCFIIPLLLYIWHKFVQPIILRYWNPWEKKDAQGNVIQKGPHFPFECKGGACPFVPGAKKPEKASAGPAEESQNPPSSATAALAAETEVDESKKEI